MRVTGAPNYIAIGEEDWRILNPAGVNYLLPEERAFKLRRASKPRPGDVFLVIHIDSPARFEDLGEVTWCDESVYETDLCYRPVRWE